MDLGGAIANVAVISATRISGRFRSQEWFGHERDSMKIAYVTVAVPWGKSEQFALSELRGLIGRGHDLVIVPVGPVTDASWPDGADLRSYAVNSPRFAPHFLLALLGWAICRPKKVLSLLAVIILQSGSLKKILKNLAVTPKGAYVANIFTEKGVEHIHGYWASTPASLAFVTSHLTGIPWSFTAHSWDFDENNLLAEKTRTARFVRVISDHGRTRLAAYVPGELLTKVRTIHIGIDLPPFPTIKDEDPRTSWCIAIPARLSRTKGHDDLLRALAILRDRHRLSVSCLIVGDGIFRESLVALCEQLQLNDIVQFVGQLPHARLLELYQQRSIDVVVLPCVVAPNGEQEGIPVSLMEAMGFGIPVISTATGAIAELVEGAGILVPPHDPSELADAIYRLVNKPGYANVTGLAGRKRIEEQFAIDTVVGLLETSFMSHRIGTS